LLAPIINITIIAVTFRIFANPIANVLQKQITGLGQHPLFVNLLTYLTLGVFSIVLIYDYPLQTLGREFWIYSLLGGIAGALGNGFIIKALEKGDLSVLGPINAYKSIIGMVFAFILIHELPNYWGILGVLLIIGGSYFVLDTTHEKFSWALLKQPAIQFRLAALVLTGIQAVLDKNVIHYSNLSMAFAGWSIFGSFFSLLFISFTKIKLKQEFKKLNGNLIGKYFALVISIGIMLASTNYTLNNMPVGYALSLFQLSIILTVILGNRIFKETHLIQKLIGAAIMISGSIIIILMK
jgi:drug/metabolite transporter (DMT)-like permease